MVTKNEAEDRQKFHDFDLLKLTQQDTMDRDTVSRNVTTVVICPITLRRLISKENFE